MRCISCSEYVPVNDKLECSGCFGCYHFVCAGFERQAFRRLADSVKLKWRCNTCSLGVYQHPSEHSDKSEWTEKKFNVPHLWASPCAAPNRCKSLQGTRICDQTSPPSPPSPLTPLSRPTSGGRYPGQPPMSAGGGRYLEPSVVPPPNRYAIPQTMGPVIRYPAAPPLPSPGGRCPGPPKVAGQCPGPACPSAPCSSGPGPILEPSSGSDHSYKLKMLLRDIERTRHETENTMSRISGLHGMKDSIEAAKTRIQEFDEKFNTFCESIQDKKGGEKSDDKAEEAKDTEDKDAEKDDSNK